jgi:hypothetical protein
MVRCEYCANFDFNVRKCRLKGKVNPYEAESCQHYFISWEYHPEKLQVMLEEQERNGLKVSRLLFCSKACARVCKRWVLAPCPT